MPSGGRIFHDPVAEPRWKRGSRTQNLDVRTATLRLAESRAQRWRRRLPRRCRRFSAHAANINARLFSQNSLASSLIHVNSLGGGGAARNCSESVPASTIIPSASMRPGSSTSGVTSQRQIEAADAQSRCERRKCAATYTRVLIWPKLARDYVQSARHAVADPHRQGQPVKVEERDSRRDPKVRQEKGLVPRGSTPKAPPSQVEIHQGADCRSSNSRRSSRHQCDQPAAGRTAAGPERLNVERARRGVPPNPPRVPVGMPVRIGAAAPRHPHGRSAVACRHRRHRRRGGGILSKHPA